MLRSRLPLTVLIAARNEAANLERCLRALGPAARVVVLDSHSTDGTATIAAKLGAEVVQFDPPGGYPKKRQWALDTLDLRTPWVLLLDADEVVPEKLWTEIAGAISPVDSRALRGVAQHQTAQPAPPDDTGRSATGSTNADAFLIRKEFHFLGRRFRFGGFSHRAVLLFRPGRARFEKLLEHDAGGFDMEVHERVIVAGRVGELRTPLIHEDFKGLEAYRERHHRYATWEAAVRHRFLTTGRYGENSIAPKLFGNTQERRRWLKKIVIRLPFEPAIWFCWHYFARGGFLEGRAGFIACRIRAQYIAEVREKLRAVKGAPARGPAGSTPSSV